MVPVEGTCQTTYTATVPTRPPTWYSTAACLVPPATHLAPPSYLVHTCLPTYLLLPTATHLVPPTYLLPTYLPTCCYLPTYLPTYLLPT